MIEHARLATLLDHPAHPLTVEAGMAQVDAMARSPFGQSTSALDEAVVSVVGEVVEEHQPGTVNTTYLRRLAHHARRVLVEEGVVVSTKSSRYPTIKGSRTSRVFLLTVEVEGLGGPTPLGRVFRAIHGEAVTRQFREAVMELGHRVRTDDPRL